MSYVYEKVFKKYFRKVLKHKYLQFQNIKYKYLKIFKYFQIQTYLTPPHVCHLHEVIGTLH